MSDIDNIFAAKGVLVSPSSFLSSKKKKKKKRSTATATQDPIQPEPSKKRRLPETIVDTSHELPSLPKRRKKDKSSRPGNPEGNPEDIAFKDSRSNAGRKRTEEGWRVYKEDELGINNQGGDTELCPFDCNCCF